MSTKDSRSITELREMDENEARSTLTVNEFERWEELQELLEGAEETREKWRNEDEQVVDLTVNADMEQIGTRVDLYGNDVLVDVDPTDRHLRNELNALEREFDADDEIDDLDQEEIDNLARTAQDILSTIIVKWGDKRLSDDEKEAVLNEAREKWGIRALVMAVAGAVEATVEEQDERTEAIDSFR